MVICEEPTWHIASAQGLHCISSAQTLSIELYKTRLRLLCEDKYTVFPVPLRTIHLEAVLDLGKFPHPNSPIICSHTSFREPATVTVLYLIHHWLSCSSIFCPKNLFLPGTDILSVLCWTGMEHFCTLQNSHWTFPLYISAKFGGSCRHHVSQLVKLFKFCR